MDWDWYFCGRGSARRGGYAFYDCTSLTAITVDALNSVYSSLDGVLFNKSQTTLIACPGGKAGSYTIPNGVSNIGNWAFSSCTILISVTISDSITSIRDRAFYVCPYLTSVYFKGNAPGIGSFMFSCTTNATVYYLAGTTGWAPTFSGRPTALWTVPAITTQPQSLTNNPGSSASFTVVASGPAPLYYQWQKTSANISGATATNYTIASVSSGDAGDYRCRGNLTSVI